MDNVKNNNYYLKKIVKDLGFIIDHTAGISQEMLQQDEVLQDCIMFRLIQVSENSARLTDDFKLRYREVPWQAIKGMRNRLVHEYGNVDLTIVFDTVTKDIPNIHKALEQLI